VSALGLFVDICRSGISANTGR